jgi:hypothetical protein
LSDVKARGRFKIKLPKFSVSGIGRCPLPTVSRFASAQAYPSRPVRIVVGTLLART